MVPLYEIFIGESLRFQLKVLVWALPDNHQVNGQYNSSRENIFPSNLVYNLNSYNLCQGIQDKLSIDCFASKALHTKSISFQKNTLPLHQSIFIDQMNALY